MKFCYGCNENKSLLEFGKDKYRNDGLTTRCKCCRNKQNKEWSIKNPDLKKKFNDLNKQKRKDYYLKHKHKYKDKALKKSFNISLEEYNTMLNNQHGVCAICKQKEKSKRNFSLCVDHNHDTNKIRGLLCTQCNRGIGLLKDNIIILESAIKYLKENL